MKIVGKIIYCSMIFVLLVAGLSPINSSANADTFSDEDIHKLAEELKFVFEEATIVDKFGNITGLNTKKLEEHFGNSIDSEIIAEINEMNSYVKPKGISVMSAKVDRCVENQIKAQYGWIIGTSAIGTLVKLLKAEDYVAAVKHLGKLGFNVTKNNTVVGLAAILVYCIYTEEGWI